MNNNELEIVLKTYDFRLKLLQDQINMLFEETTLFSKNIVALSELLERLTNLQTETIKKLSDLTVSRK